MRKTGRMLMAEAIQEVFTSDLNKVQQASIKSAVEVMGDSLLIDIFCSELFQLSPNTEIQFGTLITRLNSRIISEILFKMIEKKISKPKDIKYLIHLLTKKNDFMVSSFSGNINQKIALTRFFMAIDPQSINSKSPLKILLGKKKKEAMVARARKVGMQCRPVVDAIVRHYIEKSEHLEIVRTQTEKGRYIYVIRSTAPAAFAINYMHKKPQNVLCNKLSMNIDEKTVAREAVERITNMPFTFDEIFNKTITDILHTDLFVNLMRGKSVDEASTSAKVAQIRHSTEEGLRFWEELGKGIVYFTYVLDFRGRISQLGGISAVGNKVGKAMLRSGKSYPLGLHGYDQLLIGLASAMGMDKETFDVRLKWGKDNARRYADIGSTICRDAHAGYLQLFRNGADDPFTAAAICIELAKIDRYSGHLRDFESNLFIGYDATSSAVQLVGLIMGNETLTEASNVRVGKDTENKIHDAYLLQALSMDKAVEKLKGTLDQEGADQILDTWLSYPLKTKRAITKPLLMTRLYGSKMRTHIRRSREVAVELGLISVGSEEYLFTFGLVIAKLFNFAFDNEMGYNALRSYEDFVKGVAAAYSSKDMNAEWQVHTNRDMELHKIKSSYYKFQGESYYVFTDGKKRHCRTYNLNILGNCEESLQFEENMELNKTKSKSAIAPNYIHSLDALVLYETVLTMECPMRLTHDCFAAPVGLADKLQKTTTEVYADLFGDNNLHQLEKLQEECFIATGIKVDIPKEYNSDGIPREEIERARYAFS